MEKKHSHKSFLRILPKGFTPLEKAADFSPVRNDICLRQMPNRGRKRSSLTGFTTSEVLICVVIILILATLAIVGYTQVIDNAYQRVCATKQTIIMRGIERHFLTTGIAPATLGDINLEDWKAAYAEVMEQRDWQTKLSSFLVKMSRGKEACAAITTLEHLVTPSEMRVYGMIADVFRCPADKTPENPSYGINTALQGYARWRDVSGDMDLIADCDSYSFSSEDDLSYRHRRKLGQEQIAQTMTKEMIVKKHKKDKGLPRRSESVQPSPIGSRSSKGSSPSPIGSRSSKGSSPSPIGSQSSEESIPLLTNAPRNPIEEALNAALQRREGYVQIWKDPSSNIVKKVYGGLSIIIVDKKIASYKRQLGIE